MKKISFSSGIILIIVAFCVFTYVKYSDQNQSLDTASDYQFLKPIEKISDNGVKVTVDPMIESAYLVYELISFETGFKQYQTSDYMSKQMEYFKGFKDHEVFDMAKELADLGMTHSNIPKVIYYFDEDMNLKEGLIPDKETLDMLGGLEEVKRFMTALYDFRAKSDYDTYFESNRGFYEEYLNMALHHVDNSGVIEELKDYYGYLFDKINIVVTPQISMGYGCSLYYEDKSVAMPTLPVSYDEKKFIRLLIHELSHPYVNANIEDKKEFLSRTDYMNDTIKVSDHLMAYDGWQGILCEHIVRANTVYMLSKIYGESIIEEQLTIEKEKGFYYIDDVYKSIVYYSNNRNEYPNFTDYIDKLLSDVENISMIN